MKNAESANLIAGLPMLTTKKQKLKMLKLVFFSQNFFYWIHTKKKQKSDRDSNPILGYKATTLPPGQIEMSIQVHNVQKLKQLQTCL